MDIRVIAYRDGEALTFLYADHHDAAYEWVQRRRFLRIGDSFRMVVIAEAESAGAEAAEGKLRPILTRLAKTGELASHQQEVVGLATDEDVLDFLDRLPLAIEQKELVLDRVILRSKGYRLLPRIQVFAAIGDKELHSALEYPLDLWRVFLHPKQKDIVERSSEESLVITGGPGTGKTVCLVHRAARLARTLAAGEVVLITTFKKSLGGYIVGMLNKLGVDPVKVQVADVMHLADVAVEDLSSVGIGVRTFSALESAWEGELNPDGCLLIRGEDVWFSKDKVRQKVRHLLVDECQDYKDKQLVALGILTTKLVHTIAFDYSQSIYRRCPSGVSMLAGESAPVIRLDYCYRLNHEIVKRIKAVFNTVRVLASFATHDQYRMEISDGEEDLICSLTSVLEGTPPMIACYQDEQHLHELLRVSLNELLQTYSPEDVVITTFMPDLFKHPHKPQDFASENLPADLRGNYRYIYTLKGQEYKAGILVLDDAICQLLNLNQALFTRRLPDGIKGKADELRRQYNLLYVGLSRFRDFLAVFYPSKYAIVLDSIFRDIV